MSIPAFLGLISYLLQENQDPQGMSILSPGDKESLSGIFQLLDRIQGLASWRNKSIIAHGWQHINKEELLREYGVDPEEESLAPVEDMRKILELLWKSPQENPFDKINELLLPFLEA